MFIISSFNLATLQQFFKKRQNRRYYHFKASTGEHMKNVIILFNLLSGQGAQKIR